MCIRDRSRIDELTKMTLEEDFYLDQELVKDTFNEIKNLESKKEELSDKWFDLSLDLE